jgi:hypothetical protein
MDKESIKAIYLKKIDGLLAELKTTLESGESSFSDLNLGGEKAETRTIVDKCFFGAVEIFSTLYGPNGPQVKALFETRKAYTKTAYSSSYELSTLAQSIKGALLSTQADIENGLISNLATQASGEVIGDLLGLSKEALRNGHKDVAAVLSSAALEDAVKQKAKDLGINTEGKALDNIINALKTQKFFSGAQAPIISSYVKLRNSAMHADWDKIHEADVNSLIAFLEPFLLENFN